MVSSKKDLSHSLYSPTVVPYFTIQLVVGSTMGNALFTQSIFTQPNFLYDSTQFSPNIQKGKPPEQSSWAPATGISAAAFQFQHRLRRRFHL